MKRTLFLNEDVLPIYLGIDLRKFTPGELHVTRTIPYDVLIIMISGNLIFYEDNKRVSLHAGQWYIQKAELFQEGREPSNQPVYFYIHFTGNYRSDYEGRIPLEGGVDLHEILPLLDKLYNSDRSIQQSQIERHAIFYSILCTLGKKQSNQNGNYQIAHHIETYISQHYSDNISTVQLAHLFQYSGDYIIRLFRKHFGTTPHQYQMKLRVDQASRLLISSNKSLDEIASLVGYQDVSTLYRAFVKQMGMNPSEWLKNQTITR